MTECKTNIDELITKIKCYAREHVTKNRFEHSVRTAEMCSKLCSLYNLDSNLGYLEGIAHDMCKSFEPEKLIEFSKKDNEPVSEIEMEKPSLLHGRAAAVLLEEEFDFHDQRIIEAVANHTFGKVSMGDMQKFCLLLIKLNLAVNI